MKVRDGKVILGEVERVNGGMWFADGFSDKIHSIGAFRTKDEAVLAVRVWAAGGEPIGRIKPVILIGPPAGGMSGERGVYHGRVHNVIE